MENLAGRMRKIRVKIVLNLYCMKLSQGQKSRIQEKKQNLLKNSLDIGLWEVGAKRHLNGIKKKGRCNFTAF